MQLVANHNRFTHKTSPHANHTRLFTPTTIVKITVALLTPLQCRRQTWSIAPTARPRSWLENRPALTGPLRPLRPWRIRETPRGIGAIRRKGRLAHVPGNRRRRLLSCPVLSPRRRTICTRHDHMGRDFVLTPLEPHPRFCETNYLQLVWDTI